MGLTRIRAEQISDIDYKQAVRVITLTDITLVGGAPAEVDGVSLVVGNRVLVAGQDPGSENGLYVVQTVGAGSNGTWVRSSDGNQDGEIEAGMIVMVTEGTVYKDTQWKLTTNDPIIIGTTPLVFEQNSAFGFGNIYANGTAVLANTVGDAVTFTAGDNISILGNAQTQTITFGVTGITTSSISNGTSNVDIAAANSDITMSVDNTSNVVVVSADGMTVTGNISGTNILGNGAGLSNINAFSTIAVTGSQTVSAGNISGSFTLVGTDGVSIISNNSTNIITFSASTAGQSIFSTGGDMELITEAVTASEDLGNIVDPVTQSYDLGDLGVDGVVTNDDIAVYTITGNRLANNFVYESNFTVQGNLSVQGESTLQGNLSVQGEITQDGIVVPNQNQVFAYILAL